jgi:uncharacterized protein (TIGR02466 family)
MTLQNAQLVKLFTTPVLTHMWPQAATLGAELLPVIRERRTSAAGVSLSNVLGWQSDDKMAEWGGEAARSLRDHIVAKCDAITLDLKQTADRRFSWGVNMWANVSSRGASNQTHSHPGAYWSAVYYVDDGYEGSEDRELGGELVFLDPRMPTVRGGTPDLRYRLAGSDYDHHETWFRPRSGIIVIFPSWLMHSVRPYHGSSERISIALNMTPRPIFSRNRD